MVLSGHHSLPQNFLDELRDRAPPNRHRLLPLLVQVASHSVMDSP